MILVSWAIPELGQKTRFFYQEASVNLDCTSWKIAFCVALTKDRAPILLYLLSTTGRGPCSYLMLKGNLRLPPIREMRRSINRVKRRIIFCFSLTWQENIQHRKRHNTHRNKPGTKALRLTFGIIWTLTQKNIIYADIVLELNSKTISA